MKHLEVDPQQQVRVILIPQPDWSFHNTFKVFLIPEVIQNSHYVIVRKIIMGHKTIVAKYVKVHFEEAQEEGETSQTESKGATGGRSDSHKEHRENLGKGK